MTNILQKTNNGEITLQTIRIAVQKYQNKRKIIMGKARRAAVSVILRETAGNIAQVLLIRRTERQGDRWSGHVTYPG